jgi:EAL domain-containing protein (putative c-di-GMP-specific phosphodiesterase class I)
MSIEYPISAMIGLDAGQQVSDTSETAREWLNAEERVALRALRARCARREITERRRTAKRLCSAFSHNSLSLLYQPQFHLKSRLMLGAEAMLRLPHHRRGLVLTQYFIPNTEPSDMADEIGAWVLQRACQEAMQWPDRLSVAIILSPRQLQSGRLIKTVIKILAQTGMNATRIQIQVSEATLIDPNEDTLFNLNALRGLGMRLTLNHFGANYARLAKLNKLPLSRLKLDRSMIQTAAEEAGDAVLVRAVIEAGHAMGCTIIVDGVETEEECQLLEELGCEEAQGPYFGQPIPAVDLLSKLTPRQYYSRDLHLI